MKPRRPVSLVLVLLAAGVLAAAAGASSEVARPAGSPDLAVMSLAVHDLPAGTRVEKQGYVRDPDFVASYVREFAVRGGRVGRSRLLFAYESLDVERTPADAQLTFRVALALFRGKNGKELIKQAIAEGAGDTPLAISVGKIRRPKIGHGAISIPVHMKTSGIPFDATIVLLRFDRVLAALGVVGIPNGKLYAADTDRIARVAVTRIRDGLVPLLKAAPTIAGTAQHAQVLTAARGTWTGDQLEFTYQWERCDTAGAGCVAVPGATEATYTVGTGDLASTLRVTVTARNRLGSVSSSSAPTGTIAGPPGSPTSTVLPAISGTPQVGAILTAETGTWSGDPNAFAYQWRRCDASGGACVDIAGATGATYVVASADSRATLRVLVVATNAAGPGGAISAPTAVVP